MGTILLGTAGLWEITRGHYEMAALWTIAAFAYAVKNTYRSIAEFVHARKEAER